MYVDFDSLTQIKDDSIFMLEKMDDRSYEKDYHAQFDLWIEMHLNTIEHKRTWYNFLDFVSDIGGIQSLLLSAFALLVGVWNYNMFENYMVGRLYKLGRRNQDAHQMKDTYKESDFIKPRCFYNPKEYFRDLLPSWMCFCKGCKADRHERGFELAR